jgi:ABC-type multidrug transport system ATPase subunit
VPDGITVLDVTKTYPAPLRPLAWVRGRREAPRLALAGVSFNVAPGEVVAVIGPNGAGKSTLLRILAGLLLPTGGSARVAGLDVVADRPRSRQVVGSALGDDRSFSTRLTVRENLGFFAALFGVPGRQADRRIEELCSRLEATALLDRAVRTLSTGERARVLLARTLLHQPSVLLLDEVTRALDPGAAVRLRAQIRTEASSQGASVLFASHDLTEVGSLSSRVVLLSRGKVEAFGPYSEVIGPATAVFALPEPDETAFGAEVS